MDRTVQWIEQFSG